jgi:addiction module HigA family antidote
MKRRNVKKRGPASAVHPGEILREDFMIPLGLNATELAKHLRVSVPRVNDIVRERRAITADTAIRLSRYFGTSADVWMGLQTEYDLKVAAGNREIEKIKPRPSADAA